MFHCIGVGEGIHYYYVPKEHITPYLQGNETLEEFGDAFRNISDTLIVPARFHTFLQEMKKNADVVSVFRAREWGNIIPGIPKGITVIDYVACLVDDTT